MLPRYQPLFLFLLHLVLLLAIPATTATPTPIDKIIQSVVRRAGDLSGPTTVTDVSTINSPSGPVTQTCLITLTPITLPDGSQAVQEVKNCKLSNDAGGNTGTASAVTTTVSSLPTSTVAATPTANAALSVNGASTVTATATPTGSPSPSPDTVAIPTTTSQAEANTTTGLAANGVTTSGSSAAAAAAQQTTSGSFTIPGKKLSVLPIGLGVFAGISVIALIVVGLVTYERTKYRKAFRQRKLAEAGAQMGYGGMV